jgi:hypothetical protein
MTLAGSLAELQICVSIQRRQQCSLSEYAGNPLNVESLRRFSNFDGYAWPSPELRHSASAEGVRSATMTRAPVVRCREISAADEDAVISLLVRIFRGHGREFWIRALRRIKAHGVVPGYPQCGYLLERNGSVVGVLLLIFRSTIVDGEIRVSCNVSSWCVEPDARTYASMLVSKAFKLKDLTFLNVSPSPHTLPILAAHGYRRYASGLFVSFPGLLKPFAGGRLRAGEEACSNPDITAEEAEILQSHQAMGCVVVTCQIDGRWIPFVFLKRRYRRVIPYAHLVYCRDVEDFVRAAGLIGRFLLLHHGLSFTVICSNGPIDGLPGRYFDNRRPKYFKGPNEPRLGDLAYTELVLLGL